MAKKRATTQRYSHMSESRLKRESYNEVSGHMKSSYGARPKYGQHSWGTGLEPKNEIYKTRSERYKWAAPDVNKRKKFSRQDAKSYKRHNIGKAIGASAFAAGAVYGLGHHGLNTGKSTAGGLTAAAGVGILAYHTVKTHNLNKKYPWKKVGEFHSGAHQYHREHYELPRSTAETGARRAIQEDRIIHGDYHRSRRY